MALTVREGEAGKAGDVSVSQEAMQLAEIRVEPALVKEVPEKLALSGVVQAGGDQLVRVTPRSAGKVTKVFAGVGDSVRAGETLAVIESSDLAQAQAAYRHAAARLAAERLNLERQKQLAKLGQFGNPQVEEARGKALEAERDVQAALRSLTEEQTQLAEAVSEREALAGRVAQTEAELEVAKARLDRAEALAKEELVSKQELERVRADHSKATADVLVSKTARAQSESRIRGGKERVHAAETELDLLRRRGKVISQSLGREEEVFKGKVLANKAVFEAEAVVRLAEVEMQGAADAVRLFGGQPGGGNTIALTTPIAGRVQERAATLGETIDPEHAAFTVVNLDQVWAQLSVPPRDIDKVRLGDRIELTSEVAPGRIFRGTVYTIGTATDEATRAVSVRTTLANEAGLLRSGTFVSGAIVTDIRPRRVVVPVGALQEHTGRPTLYVALEGKPGAFEVRHVKLGVQVGDLREVTEGLKPGERVAVSGTFYLKSEALKSSLSDGCCAPSGG